MNLLVSWPLLAALSLPAGAMPCTFHLSGFITDEVGEVFVLVPNMPMALTAHVTGGHIFPTDLVLRTLGLENTLLRGRKILSVGEGYSELVPHLNRQGASALAVDLWYHRRPFPDTRSGQIMAEYVKQNRASLVTAEGAALPFRDREFDLVVSSFVLHHIRFDHDYDYIDEDTEAVRFLKEIGRVTNVEARLTQVGTREKEGPGLERHLELALGATEYAWTMDEVPMQVFNLITGKHLDTTALRLTIRRRPK